MKAPVRLATYGAGLVVAFGAAFGLAGVAIPDSVVTAWAKSSDSNTHGEGHGDTEEQNMEHAMNGVSASAAGYALSRHGSLGHRRWRLAELPDPR